MAEGEVIGENIAITGAELAKHIAFKHSLRTNIIAQAAEQQTVWAILSKDGTELLQVVAHECISLLLCQAKVIAEWFARLDNMTITYHISLIDVQCLVILHYQTGAFKGWQR
jgi:hypothetical protein